MKNRFQTGRLIAEVLIVLGIVVITVASTLLKETQFYESLLWCSAFCLAAAVGVVFLCCRCPQCGRAILKNLIGAKLCPHCGGRLFPGSAGKAHKK